MKIINNEYPNPVLFSGKDDFIKECIFMSMISEDELAVTDETIAIPITYYLKCEGILDLIKKDKAKTVVTIKSPAASYASCITLSLPEKTEVIKVPKYDVIEKIEIEMSIVANCDIENYSCPNEFNPIYFEGVSFNLRKGDYLAREEPKILYIDDSELEKPVSSIFQISRSETNQDEIEVDYFDNKINIRLKNSLYALYCEFKDFNNGSLRRYSTSVIVLPVLVEAIAYICAVENGGAPEDEDLSGYRWYRAIEKKGEKLGFNFSNPNMSYITIANKILGDLASDAMQSFKNTLDMEVNSGETELIGGVD